MATIPGMTVTASGDLMPDASFFSLPADADIMQAQAVDRGAGVFLVSWHQLIDGDWAYVSYSVNASGIIPDAPVSTSSPAAPTTAEDMLAAYAAKMVRPYGVLKSTIRARLIAAGQGDAFYEALAKEGPIVNQTWTDALYIRSDDAITLALCASIKADSTAILARDPLSDAVFGDVP